MFCYAISLLNSLTALLRTSSDEARQKQRFYLCVLSGTRDSASAT